MRCTYPQGACVKGHTPKRMATPRHPTHLWWHGDQGIWEKPKVWTWRTYSESQFYHLQILLYGFDQITYLIISGKAEAAAAAGAWGSMRASPPHPHSPAVGSSFFPRGGPSCLQLPLLTEKFPQNILYLLYKALSLPSPVTSGEAMAVLSHAYACSVTWLLWPVFSPFLPAYSSSPFNYSTDQRKPSLLVLISFMICSSSCWLFLCPLSQKST